MSIPVTIIAGYLGAGKTTLINRILKARDPRGLAIMVNDFGAINIDAELLRESADGRVRSFANGCICCSIGEDFGAALDALRQQPESIERVIVEASGVATPANLKRQCRAPGFHPHGCLVVVDAANYARKAEDKYIGVLLEQQVREADWLYVNRADNGAEFPDTAQPRLTEDEVLRLDRAPPQAVPVEQTKASTPAFTSISVRQIEPVDKRTLTDLLDELPDRVERVKGFVATAEQTLLVQQTGGRFEISPIEPQADPALVFIVPTNHESELRQLLEKRWQSWHLDTP